MECLSPRRCQGVWSAQRPDCTELAEGTGTYSRRTVWRVRLIPGMQRWDSSRAHTSGLWMIVTRPGFIVSLYPLRW